MYHRGAVEIPLPFFRKKVKPMLRLVIRGSEIKKPVVKKAEPANKARKPTNKARKAAVK